MGRPPIGKTAMTAAERQRRRRTRLGIGGTYLPAWKPWDGERSNDRRESDTIDQIEWWIENGDSASVTKWLADHLLGRDDQFMTDLAKRRLALDE